MGRADSRAARENTAETKDPERETDNSERRQVRSKARARLGFRTRAGARAERAGPCNESQGAVRGDAKPMQGGAEG